MKDRPVIGFEVFMKRRVVITGMGVVTALGQTLDSYWNGLIEGRSGVSMVTRFETEGHPVRFGGEVAQFDPRDHLEPDRIDQLHRNTQFALVAARAAARQAGLDPARVNLTRSGVMIGSGVGGMAELETQQTRLLESGPDQVSPWAFTRSFASATAGQLAIEWGWRGPSLAICTACASATNAIGESYRRIQSGSADVMLTGGAEAALSPLGLACFASLWALSFRNEEPTRASRPFDRDRDGFVLSEGAGLLVLEELDHARKRGATILAELVGYGMSSDAYHITAPDEQGRGAAQAMTSCLEDARLSTDAIDYINAHGTSTGLGDVAETRALKAVFGGSIGSIPVSSTKSHLGHLLGASGGVELIACVQAIRQGVIPPTINLDNPDPRCDLDFVPLTARETRVRTALTNSFGFGGHNACVIVKKFAG